MREVDCTTVDYIYFTNGGKLFLYKSDLPYLR